MKKRIVLDFIPFKHFMIFAPCVIEEVEGGMFYKYRALQKVLIIYN